MNTKSSIFTSSGATSENTTFGMNIKSSIFTSGGATSENTTFGVHELNKN